MDDALKQLFAAIETYSVELFDTILETNFKLINCRSTTVTRVLSFFFVLMLTAVS